MPYAWLGVAIIPILGIVVMTIRKKSINPYEGGIALLVSLLIGYGLHTAGVNSQTADTEIWNGAITHKYRDRVPCEHSYSCNCRTECSGSGNKRTCSEVCDTCYDHSHDYNWEVETTAGDFRIPRVNRRGDKEPPRWTQVIIGEPASRSHRYTNFVQAVEESLYHRSMAEFATLPNVPDYPEVYDYHRIQRVLTVGVELPNVAQWNHRLSKHLETLGPNKQANIIVIVTASPDQSYRYKVEQAWEGGNKNDIVVFIGAPDGKTIAWVDVMTWALNKGNEHLQVYLRNALLKVGTLENNGALIVDTIAQEVDARFVRPQMKDFEYLTSAISPPLWMTLLAALFNIGVTIGLLMFFHKNEFHPFRGGLQTLRTRRSFH